MSDYSANKEQLILEFDWITTLQTRFSLADSTIRHSTVFLINLAKYDVQKKKKIGTSLILLFSFLKGAAYVFVVPESFARRIKIIMAISFTLSFLFVRGLRPLGSKREKKSFKILSILAIPALPLWVCDGQKPQGHGEDNEKRV